MMTFNWFTTPIELTRKTLIWVSFGKLHNESAKNTLLKDISDSHLLHIIAWVKDRPNEYCKSLLYAMEEEQKYRTRNYIFVPDYEVQ